MDSNLFPKLWDSLNFECLIAVYWPGSPTGVLLTQWKLEAMGDGDGLSFSHLSRNGQCGVDFSLISLGSLALCVIPSFPIGVLTG